MRNAARPPQMISDFEFRIANFPPAQILPRLRLLRMTCRRLCRFKMSFRARMRRVRRAYGEVTGQALRTPFGLAVSHPPRLVLSEANGSPLAYGSSG